MALHGFNFLRRIWRRCAEDGITDKSAMLSFYFFLSVFPLMLFLVALLGLLLRSAQPLDDALRNYLGQVAPGSASKLLDHALTEVRRGGTGGKLSFGLLFALSAASKGFMALIGALNIIYAVRERRPWWKRRLLGIGLTALCAVLIVAALMVLLYGGKMIAVLSGSLGQGIWVGWAACRWMLLLALLLLALNIIYVYAPGVKHHRWHWFMPGTIAALGLWLCGSYGFKLYLHSFNRYNVTYGSIGAVIILLLWFYITGMAILVGAEINSELEKAAHGYEEAA